MDISLISGLGLNIIIVSNWTNRISFASSFTHEQLKKLIDFITVMPPEDATHARGHK